MLSTGGWRCNNWCRLGHRRWLGLISRRGSWKNTSRTVQNTRGKLSSLLSNRGTWLCRHKQLGLSIWRDSTRRLSQRSGGAKNSREGWNMSCADSLCHWGSENVNHFLILNGTRKCNFNVKLFKSLTSQKINAYPWQIIIWLRDVIWIWFLPTKKIQIHIISMIKRNKRSKFHQHRNWWMDNNFKFDNN